MRVPFFLMSLLCASAVQAAPPVYKCRVDGKLSYSDRPCPDGRGETLPPAPAGISVGAAAGVVTGDSRTLLDLEKAHTELAKREAIENREQRAQVRAGRAGKASSAAARLKAKRQAEALAVQCPA